MLRKRFCTLQLCTALALVMLAGGCEQAEKTAAKPEPAPAEAEAQAKGEKKPNAAASSAPSIHHILLEVADLERSIVFYRDRMGLKVKSQSADFATLESANVGVYLWSKRWDWEKPRQEGERNGLGMYPHFAVDDVGAWTKRLKDAGVTIVQEPREYKTFSEAFIADPDGYTWALIKSK